MRKENFFLFLLPQMKQQNVFFFPCEGYKDLFILMGEILLFVKK